VSSGLDAVLEIDVQGGASVRRAGSPRPVRIGILPPDWETLRARLNRPRPGHPAGDRTAPRGGPDEIRELGNYDYLVVNDDLETAVLQVEWIVRVRGGCAGNVRSAPSAGSLEKRERNGMARVTVEDCLRQVDNHFELTVVAAKRAKQLYSARGRRSTRPPGRRSRR